MGWAAAFGGLDAPRRPRSMRRPSLWTIGYDTIYALQDIEDDVMVGIKSSARLFGARVAARRRRLLRRSPSCCSLAALRRWSGPGPSPMLGVAAVRPAPRLAGAADRPRATARLALRLFRSNRDAGLILFALLGLDAFVRSP